MKKWLKDFIFGFLAVPGFILYALVLIVIYFIPIIIMQIVNSESIIFPIVNMVWIMTLIGIMCAYRDGDLT